MALLMATMCVGFRFRLILRSGSGIDGDMLRRRVIALNNMLFLYAY